MIINKLFFSQMITVFPVLDGAFERREVGKTLAESLRYRRNQLKNTKYWKRAKTVNKTLIYVEILT